MALLSTTRVDNALAEPLPLDNEYLRKMGLKLRQGQFSIVAAAPGVGKSLFANNLAVRTPVSTLFFSADSDEWTVRTRCLSILTGHKLTDVEANSAKPDWSDFYASALGKCDHIDWCFRTDIDVDFILLRLQAHAEIRGEYPKLIVVDNLGNTVVDQSNEWTELRGTARDLQQVARTTKAHVMGLHHVVGPKEDGFQPITQGDLLGKLAKIPEQVFGMNRRRDSEAFVQFNVAKNRGGKSNTIADLPMDYTTATIGGYQL